VFALASCSPKIVSGVQEVRALETDRSRDSVAVARWVDERMNLWQERTVERTEDQQTETVREVFSAPDTAGRQWVVERSTTRSESGASTRAGSVTRKAQQTTERTDSVAVADTSRVEAAEIREEVEKKADSRVSFIPWYVYLSALLLAVICGFLLGLRANKWRDAR
jgi:cobalamin biosynthesis Mg chelatase CobN